MTRLAKIYFPRFDGEKVVEWLILAEEFFVIDYTPEESKVSISSLHFDGVTKAWHQALVREEGSGLVQNWQIYKIVIKERFEELLDDPGSKRKIKYC